MSFTFSLLTGTPRSARLSLHRAAHVGLYGARVCPAPDPGFEFHLPSRSPLGLHARGGSQDAGRLLGRLDDRVGLDGDDGACKLIREGYVDSTGVQDVYLEAKLALDGILDAIAKGETRPNAV